MLTVKDKEIITGNFFIASTNTGFIYKEPSLLQEETILSYYGNLEIKLKQDGFISQEEEHGILLEKGIWNEEKQTRYDSIILSIREINKKLPELEFRTFEKNVLLNNKSLLEKELTELAIIKNTLLTQTVAYNLSVFKITALLPFTIYQRGKLKWIDQESFDNDYDIDTINMLTRTIAGLYSEKDIRNCAVNEEWRSIWKTACKTSTPLFSGSILDCSQSQKDLCQWSSIYDNVYDHPDRLDINKIKDHDAVDNWFMDISNKSSTAHTAQHKMPNAQEVFLPVNSREDAKNLHTSLNSQDAQNTIKRRELLVEEKGVVYQQEFSDVRQDMQMQANNIKIPKA